MVAHTLSVITVQAGVAGDVLGTRPEEAARALSSIEETSRTALHEMRALLKVLRDVRAEPAAGPGGVAGRRAGASAGPGGPGVAWANAPAKAGVRMDLRVCGERPWLPPDSTWPRTGWSRKRSPTSSSTRRRTGAR